MRRKKQSRSILPLAMVVAGVILIVIPLVWLVQNGSRAAQPAAQVPPSADQARLPFPDIERVSLADARAAYEVGSAVFVDTRGDPFFDSGHIPGALNIAEDDIEQRFTELDPQAWIITYCT